MRRYKPATARVWLHKWLKQLKQARETAAELTLHKCQREREIKKIVTWWNPRKSNEMAVHIADGIEQTHKEMFSQKKLHLN